MITMLLGGLWHGAGWNFVIWGGWHGLALCINHWYRERFGGLASRTLGWSLTMLVVMVGWFFFRATDAAIFTGMLRSLHHLSWLGVHTAMLRIIVLLALPLFALEYVEYRNGQDQLTETGFRRLTFAAIASCMLLTIFAASQRPAVNFIYFQF
jgi:alginate O-acetyltransferase complex protein AlgI